MIGANYRDVKGYEGVFTSGRLRRLESFSMIFFQISTSIVANIIGIGCKL